MATGPTSEGWGGVGWGWVGWAVRGWGVGDEQRLGMYMAMDARAHTRMHGQAYTLAWGGGRETC